jgi:hypothetical protein
MPGKYSSGDAILDAWIAILTVGLVINLFQGFRSRQNPNNKVRKISGVLVVAIVVLLIMRFGFR